MDGYNTDMLAAEVAYRAERARSSIGTGVRRRRVRRPLVRRPADAIADAR